MQAQEKTRDILDSSDEDSELAFSGQDSSREEIGEIVRGFMIEKEILSQGHLEEISRIKEDFQREKTGLLRQLDLERQHSRMASVESETGYGSHDSDINAGNVTLYGGGSGPAHVGFSSSTRREGAGTTDQYSSRSFQNIDSSLVREIAEVYLRMNSCPVGSQVRPDLDIEDKFEREREILERRFLVEKREIKRKMEEENDKKLEQERGRYESSIHELKNTVTDLQWQKRELESKIRNEKEKCELNCEREKNELEKKQMTALQDMKKHLEEKHSAQIERLKSKYEENISGLQGDIMNLTSQLRELNENLSQEKDIIMAKFEKEIKDMEQTFAEQRSAITFTLESEFSLKLQNETSVLKTLNKKLQDEFDALERDKKDLEKKYKDEKRKMEEQYEEEIAGIDKRHSEERRNMKVKFEDRCHTERVAMETTIADLREEINLLRKENSQIDASYSEKNAELRQQLEIEREEFKKKIQIEREEVRIRIEAEYSQKLMVETSSHTELIQQLDRELNIVKSRCFEMEGNSALLRQERDAITKEKDDVLRQLHSKEMEFQQAVNTSNQNETDKLKEKLRQKEEELKNVDLEKQQAATAAKALGREKNDLEDEISRLKRNMRDSIPQSDERVSRAVVDNNSQITSLQENSQRKEEELQNLKRDKFDLDARNSSLQRKNEELEDELAALRRKKLEVEDEISSIKRDKSDSDNQISYLRKEKVQIEEQVGGLKRKQSELEDAVSAYKRGKMEMEHEIALLKRDIVTLETALHSQAQKAQQPQHQPAHVQGYDREDGSRSRTPTTTRERHVPESNSTVTRQLAHEVYSAVPDEFDYTDNALKDIGRSIDRLAREKEELEVAVRRLQQEKTRLERENDQVAVRNNNTMELYRACQVKEGEIDILEKQKDDLNQKIKYLQGEFTDEENRISKLRREENGLKTRVDGMHDEINQMESQLQGLKIDERRLEKEIQSLKTEKEQLQENLKNEQVQNNKRAPNSDLHLNTGIRRHDSKDHELADLRKEKDGLKREVASLKKQLGRKQQPKVEETLNNVNYTKDMRQIEDREVAEMKKERLKLEKTLATLRRQKTETEAEREVVEEVKKREEDDLCELRKERVELEIQVTNLQSQKTRLAAELAVMKDERTKDDDAVDNLRREKGEVEKQLYNLQSKKSKVEADISMTEDTWRRKNAASTLHSDVKNLEEDIRELMTQKVEIQADITRLQSVRNREEHELTLLKKHKSDLESQIDKVTKYSSLDKRFIDQQDGAHGMRHNDITSADVTQYNAMPSPVTSPATRSPGMTSTVLGRNSRGPSPLYSNVTVRQEKEDTPHQSQPWKTGLDQPQTVTTSIMITHLGKDTPNVDSIIGSGKDNGGFGRQDTSSPYFLSDVRPSRDRYSPSSSSPRHQVSITSKDDQAAGSSSKLPSQKDPDYYSSYTHEAFVDRYLANSPSNGAQDVDGVSDKRSSHASSGRWIREAQVAGQNEGKEDNDVVYLRREKEELEVQIAELREQLTRLRFEVTNIENKKILLEAIERRHEFGVQNINDDLTSQLAEVKFEDSHERIIQDYENKVRELREKNLELIQQVGLLEWKLENAYQKLEIQEMSFRREISEAKERNTESGHHTESGRDDSTQELRDFYSQLNYLLIQDITYEELKKEIKKNMKRLEQDKINFDLKNIHNTAEESYMSFSGDKGSGTLGSLEGLAHGDARAAQAYAKQLRKQLETAEQQMKTCEKIIHRLYAENSDLNKIVLKLEGKLKTSSRSQEKLQRKRILLQKLVERLSGHVDKDQLKQSYLVFELDNDVAL